MLSTHKEHCEKIREIIRDQPMTYEQIAEAMGLRLPALKSIIHKARAGGDTSVFRVVGHVSPLPQKMYCALFAPGPGPDCQPQTIERRILEALSKQPLGRVGIAEAIGVPVDAIQQALSRMRRSRMIHIHGYFHNKKTGQRHLKLYGIGDEPDAEELPRSTDGEHGMVNRVREEAKKRLIENQKLSERNHAQSLRSEGGLNLQAAFSAMFQSQQSSRTE